MAMTVTNRRDLFAFYPDPKDRRLARVIGVDGNYAMIVVHDGAAWGEPLTCCTWQLLPLFYGDAKMIAAAYPKDSNDRQGGPR